jgi:hypothetical protein
MALATHADPARLAEGEGVLKGSRYPRKGPWGCRLTRLHGLQVIDDEAGGCLLSAALAHEP